MSLYSLDELVRAANVQHVPTSLKLLLKEAVPVEPDYEAATAKLIEQGPSDFTDENVARNIIHAAFKGARVEEDSTP